ncbi:MAG: vanillate O-demethylase oxidoreductase VanB [Comamonadaceae bacterium]|nr:MAG: vanillate O-demethylase oxidoreductase VanB [Comamonadaceae bacterium]
MTTQDTSTDRIERSIHMAAPRSRVWRAITTAEEFGRWFGANLDGQVFAVGERTQGPINIKGFEHILFDVTVERMEPEHTFAWRWHPYAIDPKVDYSQEERTLVTWTLQDAPGGGTLVKTLETGFDKLMPDRRMDAFRMNSRGWDGQLENVRRHVTA